MAKEPFYDDTLDPISPHFDMRTWRTKDCNCGQPLEHVTTTTCPRCGRTTPDTRLDREGGTIHDRTR